MNYYCYRRGDILSALLERVPETLVSEAVRLAAMELNTSLVEFVSVESTHLSNISGKDERDYAQQLCLLMLQLRKDKHVIFLTSHIISISVELSNAF
jgi:hypothetical protein